MARYKFCFWLNADKDDELLIAETIDDLKRQRSFTATIRLGIKLIWELREGRVDYLLELFPWVKDAIAEMLPPADPPPTPPMDSDYLLEQFRQMLEQQRGRDIPDTRDYGIPAMKGTLGQGVKFTAPVDDDDDFAPVITKAVSGNASSNLLASMFKVAD